MPCATRCDYDILPFRPEFQADFYRLNEAWIAPNHGMEPEDITLLSDPQGQIIDKGGAVFFASTRVTSASPQSNVQIIGTGALMKMDADTYEIVRVAVDPHYQGMGIGKALTLHALQLAKQIGAARVILETSLHPVNAKALQIYERLGFQHYTPRPEHRSALARAQVWMIYEPLP